MKEATVVFTINPRCATPLYEQLEQNIISLIAAGALSPDEQLPSVRSLARDLGVNPNTVQKAYGHLEEKGIVYQAAGRGSFVAPVDSAMNRIIKEKLDALRLCAADARRAGVTRADALGILHSVYGEDRA